MKAHLVQRRLRAKMAYEGIEQKDLAELLGRCSGYVSARMTGKGYFNTHELCLMKERLNITTPEEFIALFFPELTWKPK